MYEYKNKESKQKMRPPMPTGHLLRIKQKDTLCKMYKKTNKRIVSKQDFHKRVPFSKEKKKETSF